MTEMTMIEALKRIEVLNDFEDILVITNAGEPQLIENAIEDIMRNAEDPDEVFDLRVTKETIRELENGYIKSGEPLYAVVNEDDDNHRGMSDAAWKELFHPANQIHEFNIYGYEAVEKTVASGNKSSARINVPTSWQGKRVMVVRLE